MYIYPTVMHLFENKIVRTKSIFAFTLIELLIVVSIISILATIAAQNYFLAARRAYKSADAANIRVVGMALQQYVVDNNTLPYADHEAGPFSSSDGSYTGYGNAPAAGGSWDGVPWLLYDLHYITDTKCLFTNYYVKRYSDQLTIRGLYPRYHNFRYAYNSSAVSTGGHLGGDGNITTDNVWLIRNLYLGPRDGFYAAKYPKVPADYQYPWGEGNYQNKLEHVMYSDMSVRTVIGGTLEVPKY